MKWILLLLMVILASCSYQIIPMPFPCFMQQSTQTQYSVYESVYDMTPGRIIPDGNGGYVIYQDVYDMTPGRIVPATGTWPAYNPNR